MLCSRFFRTTTHPPNPSARLQIYSQMSWQQLISVLHHPYNAITNLSLLNYHIFNLHRERSFTRDFSTCVRSPAFQANVLNAAIASLAGSTLTSAILTATKSPACALLGTYVLGTESFQNVFNVVDAVDISTHALFHYAALFSRSTASPGCTRPMPR